LTAPLPAGADPPADAGADDVLGGWAVDVASAVPGLGAVLDALGRVDRAIAATVSWAQVWAIVLDVHRLPGRMDVALDDGIGVAVERCRGADPDVLVTEVGWVVAEVRRAQERAGSAGSGLAVRCVVGGT